MTTSQQEKTVALTARAKSALGDLIDRAGSGEQLVLEYGGEPQAVLISAAEFERFREWQRQERRREAAGTLRRLRAEISERNKDMTEEEIEAFAQQVRREVTQGLIDKGVIRFKE